MYCLVLLQQIQYHRLTALPTWVRSLEIKIPCHMNQTIQYCIMGVNYSVYCCHPMYYVLQGSLELEGNGARTKPFWISTEPKCDQNPLLLVHFKNVVSKNLCCKNYCQIVVNTKCFISSSQNPPEPQKIRRGQGTLNWGCSQQSITIVEYNRWRYNRWFYC